MQRSNHLSWRRGGGLSAYLNLCLTLVVLTGWCGAVKGEVLTAVPSSQICSDLLAEVKDVTKPAEQPVLIEVRGVDGAAAQPVILFFKQNLAGLFRVQQKVEALQQIEKLQKMAIRNRDPQAFLEAESQYGWRWVLRVDVSVKQTYNSFLGQHVATVQVSPRLADLNGRSLSDFTIQGKYSGEGDAVAILRAVLAEWSPYVSARLERDYLLSQRGDM